jgi:hypothetical protein
MINGIDGSTKTDATSVAMAIGTRIRRELGSETVSFMSARIFSERSSTRLAALAVGIAEKPGEVW